MGGGVDIPKGIVTGVFKYAEQNSHLKILIGCVWGNDGRRGRGLVALQSLSTIKKGTSPSNFQSNEPLLKSLRRHLL